MTRVTAVLAALALAGAVTGAGGAQEDRGAPDPAECRVAPRPLDEVLAAAAPGTPAPVRTRPTAPLGDPADPAVERAVRNVARELLACLNAGDPLHAAALFTDAGLRGFVGSPAGAEELAALRARLAATPTPRATPARVRLIAVTDASTLADGRVAAFVVVKQPGARPPGPRTTFAVLAKDGGGWRIDELSGFTAVEGATATPAP